MCATENKIKVKIIICLIIEIKCPKLSNNYVKSFFQYHIIYQYHRYINNIKFKFIHRVAELNICLLLML